MTEDLGYLAFDADNHYYEATDAFTHHLDPAMKRRALQWATIDGKERLLVGGHINRFIPNPRFDPVAKPGSLDDYFRGRKAGDDIRAAIGEARIDDRCITREGIDDRQNAQLCPHRQLIMHEVHRPHLVGA